MSQDPFQALYSGIGGALLLHLTTIESIYPTVCVCVIESCVKLLWVKVRVYVSACMCVGVDDGVEQRRHVHNEDGEAPGSHNNNMRVSGG